MKPPAILASVLLLCTACAPHRVPQPNPSRLQARIQARRAFNRAVALLQADTADYFNAKRELLKACRLQPDFYEAHFNLGLLRARGHNFAGAIAALRRALQCRPGDQKATFALADVYRAQGSPEQGVTLLEQFIAKNPKDLVARNNLAVLLRQMGKLDQAMEQTRVVLARDPKNPLAYNNLAIIFSEKGEPAMAEELFRQALLLRPDDPRILNNRAMALWKEKRVQAALVMFAKAFERDPRFSRAGLNLAAIYLDCGDWRRAAETFRRVIKNNPGHIEALVGEAVAERALGKIALAERSYRQILGLDLNNPQALFNLGILYMNEKKRPDWACQAFQRYLASGRASPEGRKRVRSFIEDIKLADPRACAGGKK